MSQPNELASGCTQSLDVVSKTHLGIEPPHPSGPLTLSEDGDGETLELSKGETLPLGDGESLELGVGKTEAEGLGKSDGAGLSLGLGLTEASGEGLAESVGLGEVETVTSGLALGLGDGSVASASATPAQLNWPTAIRVINICEMVLFGLIIVFICLSPVKTLAVGLKILNY